MSLPLRSESYRSQTPPPEGGGDAAVIERIRLGDESAFAVVFRAYYEPLCDFAARIVGSLDAAEDVVHAVFVSLWRRRAALAVADSLRGYLYRSVRYAAQRDVQHAARRERRHADAMRDDLAERPAVDASHMGDAGGSDAAELRAAIDRAVGQLPERCRLVFVLHREHGMTYAEIAGVLGRSVRTVDHEMGSALTALRRALRTAALSAREDKPRG